MALLAEEMTEDDGAGKDTGTEGEHGTSVGQT